MNTAIFDTHQAVKAMTNSGLNDTQAEAIVTTINHAMNQNLATKSDIMAVKVDIGALKADIGALKADIGALKADMVTVKADIGALKADSLVLKWMVGLIIAVEVLPFLNSLFT